MSLRMMRSAAACLAVLAAVVSSHPVFAEEGGPPPVTVQPPVVIDLRGEAGCGGATWFLSSPTGWKYVAGNTDYC